MSKTDDFTPPSGDTDSGDRRIDPTQGCTVTHQWIPGQCVYCDLTAARAAATAREAERDDERAARKTAGEAADRFRDVLSECLDLDENPGDDALVAIIRERSGKTGPEPTRWRDFCAGARAFVDQLHADRAALGDQP